MKTLSIIFSTIGTLALLITSFVINSNTEEDNQNLSSVSSNTSSEISKPTIKIAKELTKKDCSPQMWDDWKNADKTYIEDTVIGLADSTYSSSHSKKTIKTTLYIHDGLTDSGQIEHTAWHECGHAKTHLAEENVEELYQEVYEQYKDCEYYFTECLADGMAVIKTGTTKYTYYQHSFTDKQLEVAQKVWNASDKVKGKTKTKNTTWQDMETKYYEYNPEHNHSH